MQPRTRAWAICVAALLLITGTLAWWSIDRSAFGRESPGTNGPGLSSLVEIRQANQTGISYMTNVSVDAVNGTVPVDSVLVTMTALNAAITPTANWSLSLFVNSTAKIPICSYTINATITYQTNCSATFSVGMVFSGVTPGTNLTGGYFVFHSILSGSFEFAWIT